MNKFQQVANKIVTDSIATAACIDDRFIEPFMDSSIDGDFDRTRKLHNTFKRNGCLLDINRFNDEYNEEKIDNIINDKDLLILDWELSDYDPKYRKSLEILEQAVKKDNILFVCIYTHKQEQDIDSEIIPQLDAYFSGFSANDIGEMYESLCDDMEEYNINSEEFFDELKARCFKDCFSANSKSISTEIKNILKKNYPEENLQKDVFKVLCSYVRSNKFNITDMAELLKVVFLYTSNFYTYVGKVKEKVTYVDDNKKALFIGNTLVIVSTKDIEPQQLYINIADTIAQRPGNIFSILGLEMRTRYRNCALSIGKDMVDINEKAFLYFYDQIKSKEIFAELITKVWNNKVAFKLLLEDSEFMPIISEKVDTQELGEFKNAKNFKEELARLNAYFSLSSMNRLNKSIRFGDIFRLDYQNDLDERHDSGQKFLLCVTPHCDCLRPADKINNNFYFVRGKALNTGKQLNKALQNAEKGYYSFITKNNEVICIEWKCKMFTIYIDEQDNNINNKIECYYRNRKINLTHLNLQEENYTQRIANKASSDAARVGITYSQIDEDIEDMCDNVVHVKEIQKA